MSEIIRPAERRSETTCDRVFRMRGERDAWFRFPCDLAGNVDPGALSESARADLGACLSDPGNVADLGRCTSERHWGEPALMRCDCRRVIELGRITNTCACGRDYDSGGSLLAPREQWGEETGESPWDVVRIP